MLPTALGNAERAARDWPYYLWGLDTTDAWPHIEALQTPTQREVQLEAATDRNFFLNSALLSALLGALLLIRGLAQWFETWSLIGGVVLLVASNGLYRAAVDATVRWGWRFKAIVNLHRLEFYSRLGIRPPKTFTEERTDLTLRLNRLFFEGEAIPDCFRAQPEQARSEGDKPSSPDDQDA